MSCYDLQHTVK